MQNTRSFAITMNNTQLKNFRFITMETLQYKIIKTATQYNKYCGRHEALVCSIKKNKAIQDEIELLNLLIEKYDAEHNTFTDADPIQLLKSLMIDHKLKAVELAKVLNVSEGLVSDILNYKKGLSKETIRILSEKFLLNQEAFNRPYKLKTTLTPVFKRTSKIKRPPKNKATA